MVFSLSVFGFPPSSALAAKAVLGANVVKGELMLTHLAAEVRLYTTVLPPLLI